MNKELLIVYGFINLLLLVIFLVNLLVQNPAKAIIYTGILGVNLIVILGEMDLL
jgi:uncharacterized MnhB-related membrane protein